MLLGLVVLATVTACTTGFVYNRLPLLVSWYVNGLVSLDDAQEKQLRGMVQRTMAWHRETQLPGYIALLEELAVETNGTVTPVDLERRYLEMMGLADMFLGHVLPEAVNLLRTFSPEQVSELAENLDEDNDELWDEYSGATPEKRRKQRAKTAIRVLQRFAGSLTREQRADVESRLATMQDVSEQWLERRRHWQARFIEILRSPPPGADFEAALRDLALNPNQFDPDDYRQRVDGNRRITMDMLAGLINGLNSRQREHLGRKFREYKDDLQSIMNRD